MNIKIEFIGFPLIYDIFPEGPHPYAFPGRTFFELIEDLIARHETRVRESLLDGRTRALDPTIQVTINRKFILKDEIPQQKIKEGDHVTFLKLLAGG
jgi:sulfur carrier protein ThiS